MSGASGAKASLDAGLLAPRLQLFPRRTHVQTVQGEQRLTIAGHDLTALAERFGTPLYLYDEDSLQAAVDEYRQALATHYPGSSGLTYAGKAFLCLAMAQWVGRHDLTLDCTGAGELAVARAAGLPRRQVLVHGVNKSMADTQSALETAGTIVVDNLAELERLQAQAVRQAANIPDLWLRLRPGQAVETHVYTQTGQQTSKFGLAPQEVLAAVRLCLQAGLPLKGLHFHQGSHFHDPAPVAPALEAALDLLVKLKHELGWQAETLSPGGGWGVPYHEDDLPHPSPADYVTFLSEQLVKGCRTRQLPLPRLQLEPGRSLIAAAGVALYRVGAVKQAGDVRWLLLDGGLADNPRPALYGARYSALPVRAPERPSTGPASLGGPFCESGDRLAAGLALPDIQPGELLAIPVSGAYQLSMASNYNGACRPAVLWLGQDGRAQLIQRREQIADLLRRDLPLE